jgi:hypothetical protein
MSKKPMLLPVATAALLAATLALAAGCGGSDPPPETA